MRILIVAFWVAELVALAVYIRSCWPARTRRSFYIKLLCSTIFLAYGITLAALIRSGVNVAFAGTGDSELSAAANTFLQFTNGAPTTRVVGLIIAALAYGWIGDFFLGLAHQVSTGNSMADEKDVALAEQLKNNKKTAANALGVLAFLLGHALYCVAFGRALAGYEIGLPVWSIAFFGMPILVYIVIALKLKLGKHSVPLGVYFAAVSAMYGLATTLGLALWPVSRLFSLCLVIGGLFFCLGDLGLSLETYGGDRFKKFALRAPRQVFYFTAQMLLATTILFFYTT